MKPRYIVLVSVLVAILVVFCLDLRYQAPSYLNFVQHDSGYYRTIADACDDLRKSVPASALDGHDIPINTILLPETLADLHPSQLQIATNRVVLLIGVGRGAYGIAWQRVNSIDSYWELRTYAENIEKILFVRNEFNN
jgi:hypothetical protein